jgi:F0F1-type ATP synthase membrane subunit b/b'
VPLSRKSSGKQEAPTAGSLAATAGEQVRANVEAAEATAAQIRADAESEAEQIRSEAREELDDARERAASQASEHAGRVAESASSLLERIESIENELEKLLESLRTGASRLGDELTSVRDQLRELQSAGATEAKTPARAPSRKQPEPEPETAVAVEEEKKPTIVAEPEVEEKADEPAAPGDEDLEGARLIALNMALNGNSREDIDRYLQENFDLSNRKALLDEVYASVEG